MRESIKLPVGIDDFEKIRNFIFTEKRRFYKYERTAEQRFIRIFQN